MYVVLVVVAVGALNNLVHLSPPPVRRVAGTTGLLVVAAGAAAWLWSNEGLLPGLAAAVPWTLGALAATGLVVVAAERVPRLGLSLADRRIAAMSRRTFLVHVTMRIPVLTALVEELLFRGVLWRVLEGAAGTTVALVGSSLVFGASHVAVAVEQARREERAVGPWLGITLVATTAAGLALGGLRAVTGGLWAPAGVHAAVNGVLAVGARRAATRAER